MRLRTTTRRETSGELPAAEAAIDCEKGCRFIEVARLYGNRARRSNQ